MECGDIESPPSKKLTVWGLIEIIIMCIIGIIALDNLIRMFNSGGVFANIYTILLFALNLCIVIALVLTIWGICALDGNKLKLGLVLFFICLVVDIVLIIWGFIRYEGKIYFENIARVVVEIILAYILYKQSNKLG